MRGGPHATGRPRERAVLVGVALPRAPIGVDESLTELAQLAATAGLDVVGRTAQTLRQTHPATLVGAGKVDEVRRMATDLAADVVIVDEALSPAQQRNWERAIGRKVIDRSALILDIFAQHARSLEGRLQVELAQLQYLLPRLTRQWTHLSRLGGGVGTRGPGETQLEVDRRRVRERIGQLRSRLRQVERTRELHRRERAAVPYPTVALVGYTNAGKSTLMNALTQAGVRAEDRLFATLDPTVRRLKLPGGLLVLIADTVGFIHKLPHQLIDAFRSTLEQVRTADVLLHVVDAAHPGWPEQVRVVTRVLEELGAGDRPVIVLMNKMDAVDPATAQVLPAGAIRVSARRGDGIADVLAALEEHLSGALVRVRIAIPLARGDVLAWLRRSGRVLMEAIADDSIVVTALVPPKVDGQLRRRLAGQEGVGPC